LVDHGNRPTKVIELALAQESDEKDFIIDSLPAFFFRVRSDSDREFFFLSFRVCAPLKCMILRAFDQLSKSDAPIVFDDLGNFLMIDLDFSFKKRHLLLLIKEYFVNKISFRKNAFVEE
jgi:hypothetical protein